MRTNTDHTTYASSRVDGVPVPPTATTRDGGDPGLRLAGLTGALSVGAALVGLSVSETGSLGLGPDTPTSVLVDTYAGHADELRTGAVLCAVATVLALVFCGPLWMRFKASGEWQAMVAVAGALTMGLVWLAAAAEQLAFLAFAEHDDGEAARMLLTAGRDTGGYVVVPFLVLALAGALAALPTWFRAVSAVTAVVEAVALVPGTDAWAPAMLGIVYTVTVSLLVACTPGTDHRTVR